MESVLQSELSSGAIPSDVSEDATFDMNQSKLLLIVTGVLDLEPMLPVRVFYYYNNECIIKTGTHSFNNVAGVGMQPCDIISDVSLATFMTPRTNS
jgi:hypothetical protein